jgi:hypothetical protein
VYSGDGSGTPVGLLRAFGDYMSLKLSRFSSLASPCIVSLSLVLAVSAAACGGGDDGGGDGASAACIEAEEHSDLEWIQENVFTVSCALSTSCHRGSANSALNLNLEAGMAEANMLDVPAMGEFADGLDIVEPGQPDQSYLMVILGQFGTDDPRLPQDSAGNRITMPDSATGLDLLCPEKRDAIERWITAL